MHINAIESQDLNGVWPYILRYIQEPLKYEHGDLTPEIVYDMLEKKLWLLLVAWEDNTIYAAQTCEIINVNNERVMNLVTTGGRELERWQDTLSAAIDAVATQHNCKAIQTRGRIGWLRQLKRNGYTPLYFTAEKRVN